MKARVFTLFVLIVSLGLLLTSASVAQSPGEHEPADMGSVQQVAWNVEFVGQIGGPSYTVTVVGNYAYLGVGHRLVILNISNPARPMLVGQTAVLPDLVQDVYVAGNYAYVAAGRAGLRVVDVSDPTAPAQVGSYDTPDWAQGVYVEGQYAYVAAGWAGLRVVDVSNPAAPREVGAIAPLALAPGGADDVYVADNYAYVGTGPCLGCRHEVVVVDVSDPTTPVEVGVYHTEEFTDTGAMEVYVAGDYAYVAWTFCHKLLCPRGGLDVVDVSNPARPEKVSTYEVPGAVRSVSLAGGYAYLAGGDAGLRVVDISNLSTPVEVGSYHTPHAYAVQVVEGYAYLADSAGLLVIDAANPTTPLPVGAYRKPHRVLDVHAAGGYAYVADWDAGLRIVDMSNPTAPREVGFYETPGHAQAVHAVGNYAYVAWVLCHPYACDNGALDIVDVSAPDRPVGVGSYRLGSAGDVFVSGSYAYVADYFAGLRILDISNPWAPIEVGFYRAWGPQGVYVAGTYAYVADGSAGLHVLDVSNPAAPVGMGTYDTPGDARSVYVTGMYAYVADGFGGLRVIDVSEPTAPVEVGAYALGSAGDVFVAEGYAYVAGGDAGLRVIDVSDPTAPVEVGFYDTLGDAQGVYAAGRHAYVADEEGGLVTLWFAPSASASIPRIGGSLTSSFDQTAYTFAAATFTDTVIITHTPRFPANVPSTGDLFGIGHFFEATAVYSSTGQPAQPIQPYTITVQYTDIDKGPAIESTLGLYASDGARWVREPSSVVDTAKNTVTATPDRFGLWALLGETHRIFLPVISKKY